MNESEKIDRFGGLMSGCIWFNFRKLSRQTTNYYDGKFREVGLKITQYTLLSGIYFFRDMSLDGFSKAMFLDRTTLLKNLKPLEKDGLVDFVPGPGRGRSKTVVLTEKGKVVLKKAYPIWKKAQSEVIQKIGRNKWKSLLRDFGKISSSLGSPENRD